MVAAVAAIAGLLGDVVSVYDRGKRLRGLFFPDTVPISFSLESNEPITLALAIVGEQEQIISRAQLRTGQIIERSIPKSRLVKLAFHGFKVRSGQFGDLWGGETSKWVLKATLGNDGFWDIKPALSGGTAVAAPKVSAVPVSVILSDRPLRTPQGASFYVPEPFDTAFAASIALTGIFEVGSPECWDSVFLTGPFVFVGCLGAGIPGALADILSRLDESFKATFSAETQAVLNDLQGAVNSRGARARLLGNKAKRDAIKSGLEELVQDPAFQSHLRRSALDYWLRAMEASRRMGLRSARAAAALFSMAVFVGPGNLNRFASTVVKSSSEQMSEAERFELLINTISTWAKSRHSHFGKAFERRLSIFRSGRGQHRGVAFDLDEIGLGFYDIITGEPLVVGEAASP